MSLDEGDNDSARFLAYLVGAPQRAHPPLVEALAGLLDGPQPALPPLVLTQIVNHSASASAGIVLVLDDYHAIQAGAVHGLIGFLLEHAPPQLHLVLLTRACLLYTSRCV